MYQGFAYGVVLGNYITQTPFEIYEKTLGTAEKLGL